MAPSWMAFYCGTMLRIAIELAEDNPAYGDMASKFFEHYVAIAEAMNSMDGSGLWDETDGFYYDHLYVNGQSIPIRVRSLVGLLAVDDRRDSGRGDHREAARFQRRMEWFLDNRDDLSKHMTYMEREDPDSEIARAADCWRSPRRIVSADLIAVMLDENEFLSPFGIRSMSAAHRDAPVRFRFWWTASSRSATSRAKAKAGCSAATAIGAVRSGSPPTSC